MICQWFNKQTFTKIVTKKRLFFYELFMYLVKMLPSKKTARPEQCGVQYVINNIPPHTFQRLKHQ